MPHKNQGGCCLCQLSSPILTHKTSASKAPFVPSLPHLLSLHSCKFSSFLPSFLPGLGIEPRTWCILVKYHRATSSPTLVFVMRQSLDMLLKLALKFLEGPQTGTSPTSSSRIAGITGLHQHTQLVSWCLCQSEVRMVPLY